MTLNVINGAAINVARFPAAEEGASIVDMSGDVQVVATIPLLQLRLTALANANSTASGLASTKGRFNLAAQAAASAGAVVQVQSRLFVSGGSSALCLAAAGIVLKSQLGASTSGAAVSSQASLVNFIYRSAATSGLASVSSSARTAVFRSASTTASAAVLVLASSKVRLSAAASAYASSVASIWLKRKSAGSTSAIATGSASSSAKARRSATTLAMATSTVGAIVYRRSIPLPLLARAIAGTPNAGLRLVSKAAAQPAAGVSPSGLIYSQVNPTPEQVQLFKSAALLATQMASGQIGQDIRYDLNGDGLVTDSDARALNDLSAGLAISFVPAATSIYWPIAWMGPYSGSNVRLRMRVSVTLNVGVVSSSAALDYTSTIKAPQQRTMTVPAEIRTMKVPK